MRSLAWVLFATASATAQSIQPYTVIEVTRLFDSSGNVRSEQRFLFAVNREGSIVSMDLDPAAGGTRQIVDVSRGDVLVNPATRSASVMPRSVQLRQVGQPCDQRFRSSWDVTVLTDNAAGTIFGVPVERVSVERPDGRGMDVFMAPSLGCQILRTLHRANGVSRETRLAESLRLGDPDPALFEVPPGYTTTAVTTHRQRDGR